MAEFVSGSTNETEKIPFVFLPLASGQTIYPNADIKIFDANDTSFDNDGLCVVSSTQLLYSDGWHTLETIYGHDFYHHPFRLAQQYDHGARTHLQVCCNVLTLLSDRRHLAGFIQAEMMSTSIFLLYGDFQFSASTDGPHFLVLAFLELLPKAVKLY